MAFTKGFAQLADNQRIGKERGQAISGSFLTGDGSGFE
jgi:hypothetical protein